MDIMLADRIVYLFANAIVIYSYARIYAAYFERSNTNKRLELLCFVGFYLVNAAGFLLFSNPFVNLLTNIIPLVGITFLYTSKLRMKFLVPFLCFAVAMAFDNFTYYIILLLKVNPEDVLGGITLLNAIAWHFIAVVLHKRKTQVYHHSIDLLHWVSICFIPLGSMTAIATLFYFRCGVEPTLVASTVLLFINVLVFYLFDTLGQYYSDRYEKQLLMQQNHAYREEFALMRKAAQQVRTLRHDMKNHLTILRQYAEDGRKMELDQYLDEFAEKLTRKAEYVSTGNLDVDSILNYKLGQAEAVGATLTLDVLLPEGLTANAFDLNVILGNLLDNAIEGIATGEDKRINLVLRLDRGVLYIHLDNSYDGVVSKEKNKLGISYRSRKKDSTVHGLGLGSVQATIEKYNGQLEIDSTGTSFSVDAMLYL